jgi:hypothetical protein
MPGPEIKKTLRGQSTFPVGSDKSPACTDPYNERGWATNVLYGSRGAPCGQITGIVAIDIDCYKGVSDLFKSIFGDEDQWIARFNTYTQRTPSGGYHFIFKYTVKLASNAVGHEHNIDVRSNKGYVVCDGSKCMAHDGEIRDYTCAHEAPFQEVPEDLLAFLLAHVCTKERVKRTRGGALRVASTSRYREAGELAFDFGDRSSADLLRKAPDEWFKDGHDVQWEKLGTTWKVMGRSVEFLEHTDIRRRELDLSSDASWQRERHEGYHHCVHGVLQGVFEELGEPDMLPYILRKPEHAMPMPPATRTGEWPKLSDHVELPDAGHVLIQSDTGTGKTTLVRLALKDGRPFIIFVSREALAGEIFMDLRKADISCRYYKDVDYENPLQVGESLVCCIDSCVKLLADFVEPGTTPFSDFTVFIDEYHSLVESVLMSPTMNKKRTLVFAMLKRVACECKQLVAVDADLQGHSVALLTAWGLDFELWVNTFKHNDHVKAKEYEDQVTMHREMMTHEKWALCCDSASAADAIFIQVDHDGDDPRYTAFNEKYPGIPARCDTKGVVACVTGTKSSGTFHMDFGGLCDRIIYSPKIVYGQDSQVRRPVYAIMKEHTISARQMLQQVARTRKITSLSFYFLKKTVTEASFETLADCRAHTKGMGEMAHMNLVTSGDDHDAWYNAYCVTKYNLDACRVNQFAHFVHLLRVRGFDITLAYTPGDTKALKAPEAERRVHDFAFFDVGSYVRVHRTLMLAEPARYKALYIDQSLREHHMNLVRWLTVDFACMREATKQARDFNALKVATAAHKMYVCARIMLACGITKLLAMIPTRALADSELCNQFQALFTYNRQKKIDPTTMKGAADAVKKMFTTLFGTTMPRDWSQDPREKGNKLCMYNRNRTSQARSVSGIKVDAARRSLDIAAARYGDEGAPDLPTLLLQRHGTNDPARFDILHAKTLAAARRKFDSGAHPNSVELQLLSQAKFIARPAHA